MVRNQSSRHCHKQLLLYLNCFFAAIKALDYTVFCNMVSIIPDLVCIGNYLSHRDAFPKQVIYSLTPRPVLLTR